MSEHALLPHPEPISVKPEQVSDEMRMLLESDKFHCKIKHVASSLKMKFIPCQANCLVVGNLGLSTYHSTSIWTHITPLDTKKSTKEK
jgi:hypothetical protein